MKPSFVATALAVGCLGGGAQAASMPPIEAKVIAEAEAAMNTYQAAPNDMAKGAVRLQRGHTLCKMLVPIRGIARDWLGTVEKLSSTSEGYGVLYVALAKNVHVETWNNSLSDIETHTLIKPDTPIYNQAVKLSVGSPVVFSGNFFPSKSDCMQETSMTQEGSMTDPEFLFHFTAIAPAAK